MAGPARSIDRERLIGEQFRAWHRITLSGRRAAALATIAATVEQVIDEAADRLDVDDQPQHFARVLLRTADRSG